jgi:hypothetical protein
MFSPDGIKQNLENADNAIDRKPKFAWFLLALAAIKCLFNIADSLYDLAHKEDEK